MITGRVFSDENTKILPQSVWHGYFINQNKLNNTSQSNFQLFHWLPTVERRLEACYLKQNFQLVLEGIL